MHAAALVTLNMRELDRLKVSFTVRQVECLVQRYPPPISQSANQPISQSANQPFSHSAIQIPGMTG